MRHFSTITPRWSTASIGYAAHTSPHELAALGEHLQRCSQSRSHLVVLRGFAEAMAGFVSSRFVTTLLGVALLIGVVSLAL